MARFIVVAGLVLALVAVMPGGGSASAPSSTPIVLGRTVLLAPRSQTAGCRYGANPDRRCSPGAYYSGLSRRVICAPAFRTGAIRNVPESEKFADEREYGLPARHYGRTLEIDHIVPLELGGSNDIANLFPQRGAPAPSYHAKDKLENRVHDLVCSGALRLRTARVAMAADWQRLYVRVFGRPPTR